MGPRHILLVAAILGAVHASPTATAQQLCGGIGGITCRPGEFCELPDGSCCCDFFGTCTTIPGGCPAVFAPVCGCDGVTYGNRCEAARASVSVDYTGPCGDRTEVEGVVYRTAHEMTWDDEPGALAYNVYVQRGLSSTDPQVFGGHCLLSGLHTPRALIQDDPPPRALWQYQVTAMFEAGEGSMGTTSQGQPLVPAAPCTCTLPADPGPCDGVCPRWFYEYVAGHCEPFVWGCCGGNANNFVTQDECAATCPP